MMLVQLMAVCAVISGTDLKLCLNAPFGRETNVSGQTLYSSGVDERRVPTPVKGPVCPRGECRIYSDDRLGAYVAEKGALDMSSRVEAYLFGKVTSGPWTASIKEFYGKGSPEKNYSTCAENYMLYEGAGFDASVFPVCRGIRGSWIEVFVNYYRSLVKVMSEYKCLTLKDLPGPRTAAGARSTIATMDGCYGSGELNPKGIGAVADVTPLVKENITIAIPDGDKWFFPNCYYSFSTHGTWAAYGGATGTNNFRNIYQNGTRVFHWDDAETGRTGGSPSIGLRCEMLMLEGGTITIEGWSKLSIYPKRAFKVSEKRSTKSVVQVVQSTLGPSKDDFETNWEHVCEGQEDICIYYPTGEYVGTYNEHRGSIAVRKLFESLTIEHTGTYKGVHYANGVCPEGGTVANDYCTTIGNKIGFYPTGQVSVAYSTAQGVYSKWVWVSNGKVRDYKWGNENTQGLTRSSKIGDLPEVLRISGQGKSQMQDFETLGFRWTPNEGLCHPTLTMDDTDNNGNLNDYRTKLIENRIRVLENRETLDLGTKVTAAPSIPDEPVKSANKAATLGEETMALSVTSLVIAIVSLLITLGSLGMSVIKLRNDKGREATAERVRAQAFGN